MSDWTAVVVGALGLVLTLLQYQRANYERVERLLDYATSGDVAHSRHLLGSEPWVRSAPHPSAPSGSGHDEKELIDALFRVAWAFDRISAVRGAIHFGPRRLIDKVLGDWVTWWGEDRGGGCRYGRVAATLGALDREEHDHLARLVKSMRATPCASMQVHHSRSAAA